jgi:hypothetical protein
MGYNTLAFDLYGFLHYAASAQPSVTCLQKSSENTSAYLNEKGTKASPWKQEQ